MLYLNKMIADKIIEQTNNKNLLSKLFIKKDQKKKKKNNGNSFYFNKHNFTLKYSCICV